DDLVLARQAVVESAVDVLVVGRGSNLLVADGGFAGLAITLGPAYATIDIGPDGVVGAGAAAQLPVLARQTAAAGLTGLEWAVGVPGSVGGAVRMNAGGHGSDTASVLRRFCFVDLTGGDDGEADARRLQFAYRHSTVAPHHVEVEMRTGVLLACEVNAVGLEPSTSSLGSELIRIPRSEPVSPSTRASASAASPSSAKRGGGACTSSSPP